VTPPADAAEPPVERPGATGTYTITILRPGAARTGGPRPVAEHWAYDDRGAAMGELGLILDRVAPGTELVLRDPDGIDVLRVARVA
jgi:hypothetical protein